MEDIENVLRKCDLLEHLPKCIEEKISPDIVCKLTKNDFNVLGITNSTDIMRLRVECIPYGKDLGESKFELTREMLQCLLQSGFAVKDMVKMLGVSERTLHRRLVQYNLQVRDFAVIDDASLDKKLRETIVEFPRCGEVMLRQILRVKGLKIKRSVLRERLRAIDSDGIIERRRKRLHRRTYNVAAPNHVWHIDTNHKLIRWRFVIVGGVDGFSRFIVFLRCTDNNKARTVHGCFVEAVGKYGLPMRVRSDQGMENIEVAEYMLANGRNVISGKSTHNQRIERMWRDVYEGVLGSFYNLFYFMEDEGVLDPLDERHIFALHYVFISNINYKLDVWKNAWDSHRLRTVNSSPQRLFLAGAVNTGIGFQQTHVPTSISDAELEVDQRPVFQQPSFAVSVECRHELERQAGTEFVNSYSGISIFQRALEIILRHTA